MISEPHCDGRRGPSSASAALGVTVHDHLVIGAAGHASVKSLGLL
jgi:hypothetical protein